MRNFYSVLMEKIAIDEETLRRVARQQVFNAPFRRTLGDFMLNTRAVNRLRASRAADWTSNRDQLLSLINNSAAAGDPLSSSPQIGQLQSQLGINIDGDAMMHDSSQQKHLRAEAAIAANKQEMQRRNEALSQQLSGRSPWRRVGDWFTGRARRLREQHQLATLTLARDRSESEALRDVNKRLADRYLQKMRERLQAQPVPGHMQPLSRDDAARRYTQAATLVNDDVLMSGPVDDPLGNYGPYYDPRVGQLVRSTAAMHELSERQESRRYDKRGLKPLAVTNNTGTHLGVPSSHANFVPVLRDLNITRTLPDTEAGNRTREIFRRLRTDELNRMATLVPSVAPILDQVRGDGVVYGGMPEPSPARLRALEILDRPYASPQLRANAERIIGGVAASAEPNVRLNRHEIKRVRDAYDQQFLLPPGQKQLTPEQRQEIAARHPLPQLPSGRIE